MYSVFDTLDHNVLIYRLSTIVITDIALNWFTSYISNRSSTVRINSHSSSTPALSPMVFPRILPEVLGPLLFNIYLLPIFQIFTDYPEISFHTYADFLQLYLNCTDSPTHAPTDSLPASTPHQWIMFNSLKLNPTKTETIFIHLLLRSSTLTCTLNYPQSY